MQFLYKYNAVLEKIIINFQENGKNFLQIIFEKSIQPISF